MTSETCTLYVELGDDGQIHISPNDAVDAHQWVQIVSYWNPTGSDAMRTRDIALQPAQFDARATWLRDSWKSHGYQVKISSNVLPALQLARAGSSEFLKLRIADPRRHTQGNVDVPYLLKKLTSEQHENILCLLDMSNGANFSVPGAGKTLTTLSVWQLLRMKSAVDKLLVVCPRSAFEAWKLECAESFSQAINTAIFDGNIVPTETEILIVNYEQLENPEKLKHLCEWSQRNSVQLVLDEAHRIKAGGRSVRWRACKQLAQAAKRVDILTGTPMPQGPSDLASLFSVAWNSLDKKTLDEEALSSMVRKTTFVRTTKDELKLPKLKIDIISRPASSLQSQIMQALRDNYAGDFNATLADLQTLAKRGRAIMTLLAASTNPGLLLSREFSEIEMGFSWPPKEIQNNAKLSFLIKEYLDHELPWKFKHVAMQVEANARRGKKTLVWTSFVGNIAAIKRVLTKFQPAVVYGGTSTEDRELELQRFRNSNDCAVLITNPQTLGEGISLHHDCHDAIYVDRTYNAGLYLQSLDRIHRLGLAPDTVTSVQILITENSIDQRVANRLELKIKRLASFLQDEGLAQASMPSTDETPPEDTLGVTEEDLADLFAHWAR